MHLESPFLSSLRADVANHHMKLVNSCDRALKQAFQESTVGLLERSFIAPARMQLTTGVLARLDHGQLLALMLLRAFSDTPYRSTFNRWNVAAATFIALRAIFNHDGWTKPERIEEPLESKDFFSVFVCLMDLVAELRLIWNRVLVSSSDFQSTWQLDLWLPLCTIVFNVVNGQSTLVFGRNGEVDKELFDSGDYDLELATGADTADAKVKKRKAIEDKRQQYVKLLRKLEISDDVRVSVTPP
jgi:hypothetical protein